MPQDNLEKRIDTNKNNIMDTQEIINFCKNDANVLELWKRLERNFNTNFLDQQKNKKFYDAVSKTTLNNREFQNKIQNKINKGVGQLTDSDVFLLYLQSLIDPSLAFSSFKPIISQKGDIYTRYGWQFLLNYIRTKYKNQKYEFWRWWPNILPTTPNKPRTVNEFLKQKKEIILPNNIDFSTFKENTYMPAEFGKLDSWTRENFSIEYDKERIASRKRNAEKWNRINDYIKFDLYIFSLKKYDEYVEKSHNRIVIWVYWNKLNYDRQQTLAKLYFEDLEKINKLFPNIQDIIKNLTKYFDEIKKNQNKYLKNEPWKTMEEKEKIAQNKYEAYVRELEIKQTEIWINDIKESFTKEVTTEKDAKIFFENINKLEQFKTEQEKIKSKYGKSIDNYESFSKSKWALINLYWAKKIQNWLQIYNNYSTKIKSCGDKYKWFDSQKYQMYTKKLSESNIRKHIKNIKIFKENLNIESKGFPINSLKKDYEIQKKEQADTDKRRENLKKNNYLLYQVFSIWARWINALVSATRWTGAKLWALISSLWHDDDEMVAVRERTENSFRNPHIPLSSKQTQSVYENGHINFNRDNWPWAIADWVVNMRTLIAWWWAIWKGLVKGAAKTWISVWTKWVNITSKIWLFSSSFLQQAWPSFQEWFNAWMTWNQALLYCVLNAWIQWWLELVSPNEILLWSWSKLAKTYVKQILKSESKESRKAIWRLFLKNVWSEIGEENIQEALQLWAGNLINMWANDQFDLWQISWTKKLDTDRNPKNFAATALVTTLTTWLVTGGSFALQSPWIWNNQKKEQLIWYIQKNNELHSDVMNILDKAIAWKVKIPNVNVQQLQDLKWLLNSNVTTWNTDYFNWKSKKLFEWDGTQASWNSEMMDNLLNEVNREWITKVEITDKLNELRNKISEQYNQSTWEELNLTDEQLLSILDAHEQDWILWELTLWQLKQKVKILSETVTDPKIRRFLLEAGFCGKTESITQVEYSQTATNSFTKFLETNTEIQTKIESGKFKFIWKNIEELYKKGLERALEWKTESEYEKTITNYNSEFLNNLQSLYKKMEENYKKFTDSNPEIQTKIESGKFEFMWKNIEELYKKWLNTTLEWKPESQHESLIFDFNTRFSNSLEFLSDKESTVKFLDSKTWKLVEWTITDYWKSLLWENFESSPTKKAFFDKLKASMFYQHLDNPLKYCSHGADHSILVDRYVQNIVESYPDVVNKVQEKYWVNEEWARQLLRLTAVFHDFGYPDIWWLAKAMHGPFGWAHFINEFASSSNSTFTDFIKNDLWITDQTRIDQLVNDMRDAIFFHSADKVEKWYLNKITYTKWQFLIWDNFSAEGTNDFIEILNRESDWVMTITYRSEEWRINAENFKKKMLERYPSLDWNKIKIEEDTSSYNYDEEFDYKKDENWNIMKDEDWNPIRLYEYHWRKWKTWDSWIEFQPIDLLTDPLAWIVRLADNMDMSFDRLTKIQSHPIFMNLFYNIWYEYKLENWEINTETASYIYQKMEKLNKLDKKLKDWEITQEKHDSDYAQISTEIQTLINEANLNWWLEMTIFDEKTWRPKEWNSKFRVPFDGDILKPDWKVDLYTYKQFIIDAMATHEGIELNNPDIQTIQNIAIDNDIWSYSFRHFIWLTPIKDVTMFSEGWYKKMVVEVDKNIYLNPELRSQKLTEWSFKNRPVVEYHIWRLFDASWRVQVDWDLLQLEIIDKESWERIWFAERESATDKFDIQYTVELPK